MEVFIKIAQRYYERLQKEIPPGSAAHEAFAKATPIEYSLDGVEFEGANIPCDESQAKIILDTARRCCPEIVRDVEQAIKGAY